MPTTLAQGSSGIQPNLDARLMDDFPEENDLRAFGPFQNDGHPGRLAAGVELDPDRLEYRGLRGTVLQSDGKRSHVVHLSPTAFEQLAGALFGTWH
jgi:hypothetical protein